MRVCMSPEGDELECHAGNHVQAVDNLMPGFDKEIARTAQRLLINPRRIDYHTGVLATKVTPGLALCCPLYHSTYL